MTNVIVLGDRDERPWHPFFIATAFQPQVGVRETGVLPPLIIELLRAAETRTERAAA